MKLTKLQRYGILKAVAEGKIPAEFTSTSASLTDYPFSYLMIVASDTATLVNGDVILKGSVISMESSQLLFAPVLFKTEQDFGGVSAYYNQVIKYEGEAVVEGDLTALSNFVVDGIPLFESVYVEHTAHMAPYVLK